MAQAKEDSRVSALKPKGRWGRVALKAFLLSVVVSGLWSWGKFFSPGAKFVGSPPRQTCRRNTLDLANPGSWYAVYGKGFRPSRPLYRQWSWFYTLDGPALYAGPIVHYFSGWDIYAEDICDEGVVSTLHIWPDDGDVGFNLIPLDPDSELGFARYGWRPGHPEDKLNRKLLLVEIDGGPQGIRNNFSVLHELADGDLVRVCGRWVYDRAHDHNEIHPARWVEIIKQGK